MENVLEQSYDTPNSQKGLLSKSLSFIILPPV